MATILGLLPTLLQPVVASAQLPFLTRWGTFGSGSGQFSSPRGITTDGAGNVYVADEDNDRIQKFTSSGIYLAQWGVATPSGVAMDAAGHVFVSDRVNNCIHQFSTAGSLIRQWGVLGAAPGQFNDPVGVATDGAGNVFVVERANHRVQKFTNDGAFVAMWGTMGTLGGQFKFPLGIGTDPAGSVYVADWANHRVQRFTNAGAYVTQWGSLGSAPGQLEFPTAVASDSAGNVYVADSNNCRIQQFTSVGGYVAQWGGLGSLPGQFRYPYGVAMDATGHLYVADTGNHRIQKFGPPDVPQIAVTAYFFIDRQGTDALQNPIFLSSFHVTGSPARVCADGADAELVTFHVANVDAASLQLRIKEDPAAASPDVYGSFRTRVVYSPDSLGIRYVHPTVPPPGEQQARSITLELYDSESGQSVLQCPIEVYRAPVVMIHGLWSDKTSFDYMMLCLVSGSSPLESGRYPQALVSAADYGATSSRSFHENRGVVRCAITNALRKACNAGYGAAKVDIVGHSMGGLLTRIYLQDSFPDAPHYGGDIFRLITLNSPHWGSQCANLLTDAGFPHRNLLTDLSWLMLGKDLTAGAVDNLRVDSPGIVTLLNGPGLLNRRTVPTHVISTEGEFDDQGWTDFFEAAFRTIGWFLCEGKDALRTQVFTGAPNDIVVERRSQLGGIPTQDIVTGQVHTGSPSNNAVISDLRQALATAPSNSSMWSTGGFTFSQLTYPGVTGMSMCPLAPGVFPRPLSATGIAIGAPVNGGTVVPGELVQVSMSASPDVTSMLLLVGGSRDSVGIAEIPGSSGSWSFTVPRDAIGMVGLQVFGAGGGGVVASAVVRLNVYINAALDFIDAQPEVQYVEVGTLFGVSIYGHYVDGVTRSLLGVPGVSIVSSDDGIVRAARPDSIEAIAPGTAVLTIEYQGMSRVVPVTVSSSDVAAVPYPQSPGDTIAGLILSVTPNPATSSVGFRFSVDQPGDAELVVFDLSGRRVWNCRPTPSTAEGIWSVTWDGMGKSGRRPAAGVYFARLRVGSMHTQATFVLR